LTDEAASNEEKDKAFTETFFSPSGLEKPPNNDYEYPAPKFSFSPISNLQITRAIMCISPHKPLAWMASPTLYT